MRSRGCPVEVISLFDAEGQIQPLRIRYQDEHQIYHRVNVEKILKRDLIGYAGAETVLFHCRVTVDELPRMFGLKYSVRNHRWSLYCL